MPPKSLPPAGDREEERVERRKLDQLDSKIRELRPKRQVLIQELLRLSEEQHDMFNGRGPQQARLEQLNEAHRQFGRDLARLRNELDVARRTRDERLAVVRELRAGMPMSARSPAEQLRREMSKLELLQQTRAVPLAEENALIDQMRQLRKEIARAETEAVEVAARGEAVRTAEARFESARAEVERLRKALDDQRAARDKAMGSLKEELVVAGQAMARLREKNQARGLVRRELDEVDQALRGLEREFELLRRQHHERRGEARRQVVDHNRSARRAISDPSALDRAVDDRLEQLLKGGKIRLT
jgi:chromosome segregation ATPase